MPARGDDHEENKGSRDSKHDFSYANNWVMTSFWMAGIKRKCDNIFPIISNHVKALVGNISKQLDSSLEPSLLTNIHADLDSKDSEDDDPKDSDGHSHGGSDESNVDEAVAGPSLGEEPTSYSQRQKSRHITMD